MTFPRLFGGADPRINQHSAQRNGYRGRHGPDPANVLRWAGNSLQPRPRAHSAEYLRRQTSFGAPRSCRRFVVMCCRSVESGEQIGGPASDAPHRLPAGRVRRPDAVEVRGTLSRTGPARRRRDRQQPNELGAGVLSVQAPGVACALAGASIDRFAMTTLRMRSRS
jgi:hypothetical protein